MTAARGAASAGWIALGPLRASRLAGAGYALWGARRPVDAPAGEQASLAEL